jgi:2-methylaconitate cis-trans-isomerase PrpF
LSRRGIRAVYVRGGTSRALMFHSADLPAARYEDGYAAWNEIFLKSIGSPDPHGRQLNGMGGGITSLSKVAVIGPPSRPDADVDYTFGQVGVFEPTVSYRGNCGNISSAVGPFAVDEMLIPTAGRQASVRIHNTNTRKIIVSEFAIEHGRAIEQGDFEIQGVAGRGAPIRLTFLDPGGATTGKLLPTGSSVDELRLQDGTVVKASLVDAANPVCFVSPESIGLTGRETQEQLISNAAAIDTFKQIRLAAAVAMGLCPDVEVARRSLKNLPLVSTVASPDPARYAGEDACNLVIRMVSSDQPHKASPLTGALCVAAAAAIPGSLVANACVRREEGQDLHIVHASGMLPVAAEVLRDGHQVTVTAATAYRTTRRLMEGNVCV